MLAHNWKITDLYAYPPVQILGSGGFKEYSDMFYYYDDIGEPCMRERTLSLKKDSENETGGTYTAPKEGSPCSTPRQMFTGRWSYTATEYSTTLYLELDTANLKGGYKYGGSYIVDMLNEKKLRIIYPYTFSADIDTIFFIEEYTRTD